jgi:hypothetical protein
MFNGVCRRLGLISLSFGVKKEEGGRGAVVFIQSYGGDAMVFRYLNVP